MRIPDGDLVPARRRPYGGGYARRRRPLRMAAVLAAFLLVAGGATWFLRRDDRPAPRTAACPTASPSASPTAAALPAPAQIRFAVLNGTPRSQLAQQVGSALAARGFVVVSTGNASTTLAGASVVTYGPGEEPAATVLGRQVLGALVMPRKGLGPGIQVVLGSGFLRLATPAEVAAAAAASPPASVVPAPTRTPCSA